VRHALPALMLSAVALVASCQVCIVLLRPLLSRCALPVSGLLMLASPPSQMATAMKDAVKPGVEEAAPVHRIRITLSSRNVKNLEKGASTPPPPPPLLVTSAHTCFGSVCTFGTRGCALFAVKVATTED